MKGFKYTCITDLMDHYVSEGNRLFKGSTREHDWMIKRDFLPQWWEVESQQYLHDKHKMRDRQWRALGSTNERPLTARETKLTLVGLSRARHLPKRIAPGH